MSQLRLLDIYQNIYHWKNINEFLKAIRTSIVYKSPDNSLVAIHKPFGVGSFTTKDNNKSRDKLYYKLNGYPKYCIQDALDPLTQELSSKHPYKILKSIDRYTSGIVLISNNYKKHHEALVRSMATSRCQNLPPYRFRAITSGYTVPKITEKVGIELIEVDEMGDHKEPTIVSDFTNRHLSRQSPDTSVVQVELELKKVNRELSVSLVELYVSKTKWDFARCYISSKAAFVLGDIRFSKRVREVFGVKMKMPALNAHDDYEPLSEKLRDVLKVKSNSQIPLMLDQFGIRLKNFDPKKPVGERDLVIESPYWPLHMRSTADVLNVS